MDLGNKYIVGAQGDILRIMRPPMGAISREDALNLAAWLVALADCDDKFPELLAEVQNT